MRNAAAACAEICVSFLAPGGIHKHSQSQRYIRKASTD